MLNSTQRVVLEALRDTLEDAAEKALSSIDCETPNADVGYILVTIERAVAFVLSQDQE